ncbi:hypothetical protein CLPU_5c02160 [Gottschalkia purinilytica]|uniref:Uncharacterized protein n=1 Tax=Gottschalkia purinilytica TaxID=1503 RepID=A0A0L0WBK3_GOTPU|nr:hypothetical protein [Gottschalkia purinilytica]KNF08909.1 hypothetical protein CLPU_5c02160 [Gottschalkia purinilytica]
MNEVEILLNYFKKFRVECHFRLDMVGGPMKDFPMHIYEAAYKQAKEDIIKEYNLSNEMSDNIDKVNNYFIKTLKETDHYGKADDLTVKLIESKEIFNI